MAKRRNRSDSSTAASFKWDLFLYCENVTKEKFEVSWTVGVRQT